MRSGEAVAVLGDYPAMAYAARESAGRLEVVGEQFAVAPYAIATSKEAPELTALVASGLNGIILDGSYRRILEMWALEAGAVNTVEGAPQVPPSLDQVPQLADGTLTVGMEVAYAPMEFHDEAGMEAGIDVEIIKGIAQGIGVEVEIKNLHFDQLIPSLADGSIDVAISSITVTPERGQQVNLIPYFMAGSGILVPADNPAGITSPADLCDHPVAVQANTVHVQMLQTECQ
jgi:ABC-type amino acid transport substrate-binding protein